MQAANQLYKEALMRDEGGLTSLPQDPIPHTSLEQFCCSKHMCTLVSSQKYPTKATRIQLFSIQECTNKAKERKIDNFRSLFQ